MMPGLLQQKIQELSDCGKCEDDMSFGSPSSQSLPQGTLSPAEVKKLF